MTSSYEYADLGYNYRMSDLHGAIAVEQLKKVEDFTNRRQHNANMLNEALAGIEKKSDSTKNARPNTTTAHTTPATLRIVIKMRSGDKLIGSVPSSPFCSTTAPINWRSCLMLRSFTFCFFFIVIPPDVQRSYLLSPKILFKPSFRMIP